LQKHSKLDSYVERLPQGQAAAVGAPGKGEGVVTASILIPH